MTSAAASQPGLPAWASEDITIKPSIDMIRLVAMSRQHTLPLLGACLVFAGASLWAEQGKPAWPPDLTNERRTLLEPALAFLEKNPAIPYKLGSADASGMDCSGAIFFLLKQAGQEPPRSAHEQYLWMKKLGRLTEVPATARSEADPVFAALLPGDLVFYAHDGPDAPAEIHASHVHMYLGKETDGHAIMIGSSEGRSYRHQKINGFGITDFHVPAAGAKTRIIGYGPPPPLAIPTSPAPSPLPPKPTAPPNTHTP
jgi:cell wall-associated NlpC family hydrolase